jgi:hypothetical protein
MTDLELLTAELERQDRELESCFEQMRGIDPDLVFSVSPEWAQPSPAQQAAIDTPAPWALRA